jgi:hypothetical protein
MAEEQHNNGNGEDADRADDVANNVSDTHGVFSFVGGWWGSKPPVGYAVSHSCARCIAAGFARSPKHSQRVRPMYPIIDPRIVMRMVRLPVG